MSDEYGGDDFEASLRARFAPEAETTETTETATQPEETPDPEASTEPAPQAEPQEPIRDEQGRFTNEQKLLEEHGLTQFKSVADALKSYRELQGLQGRQAQEIGEIRQQLQEYSARLDQQPITPQTPVTQDLIDANPGAATELAYQQGNQAALAAAFEAWEQEQPARAAAWIAQKQIEQVNAQWTERYSQLEQQIAPVHQRTQQQQIADAYQNVAARIPDINQFGDAILEAAQTAPEVVSMLQSGTQQDAERVFENLYWLARGRQADTHAQVAAQAQAAQAEANKQAKAEAVVASVSSRPTSGEGKDAIERFKQSILGVETGLVDRFAGQ